jgi:general secretion pathway protein D
MIKHILPLCLALILTGCGTDADRGPGAAAEHEPLPPVPLIPALSAAPSLPPAPPPPAAQIIRGSGASFGAVGSSHHAAVTAAEGDVGLNFVNADIAEIAKGVLGDLLKLDYVIDATVQGAVTLQTSRPLARDAVLPAFEEAIRLAGLALVHTDGLYRIVPLAEAPRNSGPLETGTEVARGPGYGVNIVPLRYVGVADMQRLLEPLVPSGSLLRGDPGRNLLLVGGTQQERAAILDNIRLFDVDQMRGMSFALLPLHAVDAKTMIGELRDVMGGKDGLMGSVVRLSAIPRTNSILAISPQAKYLDELNDWVQRLDRGETTVSKRVYVYYVQNGRASDLAGVLNKVLVGHSGTAGGSKAGGALDSDSGSLQSTSAAPAAPGLGANGAASNRPAAGDNGGLSPDDAPASEPAGSGGGRSGLDIRIDADQANNALVILAAPADYALIESALARLDVAPLQVLLEAAIAEVTLTNDLQYGLQYAFTSGSSHKIINSNGSSAAILPTFPGFNYIFTSGTSIQAVLTAISDITTTKVLSAPKLLVLNNQTATLEVGDQVPVQTQSATSVSSPGAPIVSTIEFQNTGVILKVTPRVNKGGLVLLDISQEVSSPVATTSSTIDSPTIQQRKVSSSVAVQDGETIALGGIIQDTRTKGSNGIPFLQEIPYVGALFGTKTDDVTRTELLVMITPHVVQGVEKLRSATEEMRQLLPQADAVIDPRQQ